MPPRPPKPGNYAPAPDVRLSDLFVRVAVATMMFVAGTWWALGRTVAEKIMTALVMPAALMWLLLLVAILAARRAGRRDLMLAAVIPWTLLTLLGNGIVAGTLALSLESPYLKINPLESEPLDAIVLLGGGTSVGGNERVQGNGAGDRVLLAAEMYHAGLTKRIICTGHRIVELNPDGTDQAEQARELLVSLGVPEQTIEMLDGRNTSEEMRSLGESIAGTDQRIGLITSAWHLPRALRLAAGNNVHLEPLPADFITPPDNVITTAAIVLACIPQDGTLWTVSRLLKEYLATLAGR